MTHPTVFDPPLPVERAVGLVRSWFDRPVVQVLESGPRPPHLEILARLLAGLGVGGNLTSDAHLAAIAIEHQCFSADSRATDGLRPVPRPSLERPLDRSPLSGTPWGPRRRGGGSTGPRSRRRGLPHSRPWTVLLSVLLGSTQILLLENVRETG